MGVERVIKNVGKTVGLAVRDYFDVVFFGHTQKEVEDIKSILAGHITEAHRDTYWSFRLRTTGLRKEPTLVTDGWLIAVTGYREVQDPRAVELEIVRLRGLTQEQYDQEVRRDALLRVTTGLGVRGINPSDYIQPSS